MNHSPHRRGKDSTKACNGVSSLAPHGHTGDTVNFFTGGYDKAVRLWKVNTSNLDSATSEEVIKLATIPETLAFRQSRHSLLTSTSKRLMDVDLGHLSKKPAGFPMSNPIYQLHVQKENQNVVILEACSQNLQHARIIYEKQSRLATGIPRYKFMTTEESRASTEPRTVVSEADMEFRSRPQRAMFI